MVDNLSVGFLLSSLGANQAAASLTREAWKLYGEGKHEVDVLTFYQNAVRPLETPPFAAMNVSEAFDFSGVAVATTAETARTLLRCPGPRLKYFYVYAMEWVSGGFDYETLRGVYRNPKLSLIARSESHRGIIERCWNTKVRAVVDDFDLEEFVRIIREDLLGQTAKSA